MFSILEMQKTKRIRLFLIRSQTGTGATNKVHVLIPRSPEVLCSSGLTWIPPTLFRSATDHSPSLFEVESITIWIIARY